MSRLRRMEQFLDRLGIDETRLDEVSWITEQIKSQQESNPASQENNAQTEELAEKLGQRASIPWIKQLVPLLQAAKHVQQIPSTAQLYPKSLPIASVNHSLQATLTESGQFLCPAPKPTPFPQRVPLSVLNKTMFELSVHDCTQYLGPVAGTRAVSWSEEMRFTLPWLVPEPQVEESLLVLPPLEEVVDLIEWMVQSPLYVYLPILSKACILNAITLALPDLDGSVSLQSPADMTDETGSLPQQVTGRVSAVFLLNAIMALGAAYRANAINQGTPHKLLSDPMAREKKYDDFQVFFDRCRALTAYILDQPRVSSLQALLLLMKCPAIPGIQNLYREQACAMALALGLHRDPEPWTLCRSVIQLRRNIFWCCFVIDASYSLNSGSPERFPCDYITVGLPEKPSVECGDDLGEIEAENETQRIGFLIEQAKLWRIVKKIRRCGQTSNKSSESYCEGNNLYRNMDANTPSTPSGQSSPPWVWRADSARRILDVELAQWQMDLPQNLRFDFALTRQDDPCPFLVRINGLGAMLQIIFNEVLILLHHPFLVLADPSSQLSQGRSMHASGRQTKPRSNTGPTKSPRSRRSSSASRPALPINLQGGMSLADDSARTNRALSPFLNTCTKAAEAITFLIDHLLRTTPEWLVCHNEVESAMHMAERVHSLNVTLATNNSATGSNGLPYTAHVNGQQAKCQLKKTRAFRKTIKELDQFTMSTGYRPDLMTKELLAKGSARERLVRSMRQFLLYKRGSDYYRLPRSPPESELSVNGNAYGESDSGIGQDHLEMRLAYFDHKVWVRYYNIRIKDGIESRNGNESWLEILNPHVSAPDMDVDSEEEEVVSAQPVFGFLSADDFLKATFHGEDFSLIEQSEQGQRRRTNSSGDLDSTDGVEEPMDPPQSSSSALMDFFSHPDTSSLLNLQGMNFYPQDQTDKRDLGKVFNVVDTPVYPLPLDTFETSMTLDGSANGSDVLQGYQATQHQGRRRTQSFHSNGPYQQAPYQLVSQQQGQQQQDQHGSFFDLHTPTSFESSVPTSTFTESPSVPSRETDINIGLLNASAQLTLQPSLAIEGPYLNIIHQHFPHQPIPTQTIQQQQQPQQQRRPQPLNPSMHIRGPFFGVPVGGFMGSPLDTLPEISRSVPSQTPAVTQQNNFLSPTSPMGQQQQKQESDLQSWPMDSQGSHSPALSSLTSSGPASPLPPSSFGMVLSGPKDTLNGNYYAAVTSVLSDTGSNPGVYSTDLGGMAVTGNSGSNTMTRTMDGIEAGSSTTHHHHIISAVPDPFSEFGKLEDPQTIALAAIAGGEGAQILQGRRIIFGGAGRRF